MPDERRPVLGVVAGPNGSGKTTITEEILKHKWLTGCAYINPDNIAQELGDWNDPKLTLKAARQAEKEPERLLRQKESMAFETVFSAPDKLDYVRRAHEAGYFIRFFFVSTDSPAINAARVTTRYMSGGHAVPIEKIVDRYYRSIEQCMKAIPWVDRLDVFDNSGDKWMRLFKYGPERHLKVLAREPVPAWAESIYKEAFRLHEVG